MGCNVTENDDYLLKQAPTFTTHQEKKQTTMAFHVPSSRADGSDFE
jgi:hypothetical protein